MKNQMKIIANGKHIHFCEVNGWEFVDRVQASGAVGIAAVTKSRELVLVEQLRPPLGKQVIDIPAGLVGDVQGEEDEPWRLAAQRELLEETGFHAEKFKLLTTSPSAAGISSEIVRLALATDLSKMGDGGGDETENIQTHLAPLDDIEDWLDQQEQQDKMIDFKIFVALYFINSHFNN